MSAPPTDSTSNAPRPIRLLSLDAFRGFVMIAMLVVNSSTPASFHWQFAHRGWNAGEHGASFCDMVFPWFLFAVGVAIPFSMGSGRGKDRSAISKLWSAFCRALVIYTLGLLITAARREQVSFFVWDILPIIAWSYFLGVALYTLPQVIRLWVQGVFVVAVLAAKWYVLTQMPYPGEAGVLWEQTRNMQTWIQSNWLTIRQGPLAFVGGWPGGLTQLLPGTAVVVLGMWSALLLRASALDPWLRGVWLLAGGAACTALAYMVEGMLSMPFSKDFFTSSYVLLSAGTGAMLLALFYLALDAFEHRREPGRGVARAAGLASLLWLLPLWTLLFAATNLAGGFEAMRANLPAFVAGAIGFTLIGLIAGLRAPPGESGLFRSVGWLCAVPGRNAIALYVGAEVLWRVVLMGWKIPFHDGTMQTMLPALKGFVRDDWTLWPSLLGNVVRWPGAGQAVADWTFCIAYTLAWWKICHALYKRGVFFKV